MTKATKSKDTKNDSKARLSDNELSDIVGGMRARPASSFGDTIIRWEVGSVTSL